MAGLCWPIFTVLFVFYRDGSSLGRHFLIKQGYQATDIARQTRLPGGTFELFQPKKRRI